jgi:hypothetical protein
MHDDCMCTMCYVLVVVGVFAVILAVYSASLWICDLFAIFLHSFHPCGLICNMNFIITVYVYIYFLYNRILLL